MTDMFTTPLHQADPELMGTINREYERQRDQIELIASENIVSRAVLMAQGSVMTNKYAEGYPGKRYYGGCAYVDEAEELARKRACKMFNCGFANVQPHSGSQANQAVFAALLQPGDKILGMALDQGGHLTHGAKVNLSGKWFDAHFYGITPEEGMIDYEDLLKTAQEVQPKLIIAGASAYPRTIDFAKFREVADAVGAYLLVDMAHIAGLVATDQHPSPFPHAHVATTTTHKTLRGPRGGMILTNDETLAKKFNSAIFPGLQGGPLMHVIAAKAVAFGEALQPQFQAYGAQIVKNAHALAQSFSEQGLAMVTGGTDNHLILMDLTSLGITGKAAEDALERAGLTCNKNAVPNDPQPPTKTSGIRVGTPAGTTRGFKEAEFTQIGQWIGMVLKALQANPETGSAEVEQHVRRAVKELCDQFPIYHNALEEAA